VVSHNACVFYGLISVMAFAAGGRELKARHHTYAVSLCVFGLLEGCLAVGIMVFAQGH
jgi:hypothetical protein